MNPIRSLVHRAGRWYTKRVCIAESDAQRFSYHNERVIEYRFALEALGETCPKTVLDVGTGTTAWPHLMRSCGFVVTAIDNIDDYWDRGMVNRHWPVLHVDITRPGSFRGQFDAITCISVLEHIDDHEGAVKNILDLLVPGGLMIITTPYSHSEFHPNVYKHPNALPGPEVPYICRSHGARELESWERLGARLIRKELWRLFTGPVWRTGERAPFERVESEGMPHQLGCFAFVKA